MSAAEIAYEAYRAHIPATEDEIGVALHAFRSRSGDVELVIGHKLPPFAELEPRLQAAWGAAAAATLNAKYDAVVLKEKLDREAVRGGSGFGGANL